MKKLPISIGLAAAAALGAMTTIASATPSMTQVSGVQSGVAEHPLVEHVRWRGYGYRGGYGYRRGYGGAGLAAGIAGAAIVGGVLAAPYYRRPYGYGYPYGYAQPYGYAPGYYDGY